MFYAELRDQGLLNAQGEARRLLHDYRALRQTQIVLSRELGLHQPAAPRSGATGTRAALDLAAAMAGHTGAEEPEDAEEIGAER